MLSIFKKNNSPKSHLIRLKENIHKTNVNFNDKLEKIEMFADDIYKNYKKSDNMIKNFKRVCHSFDTLITDKDKDLNMTFANHSTCVLLYGLPEMCSDLIEGRKESDVINDYIEKTGQWNSFVERANFNIDQIVKDQLKEKKFIQIGYVNNKKTILETIIKPHLIGGEFDGVVSVSNIVTEKTFNELSNILNLIYDKNNYTVFAFV